jgi:hypothetical protein
MSTLTKRLLYSGEEQLILSSVHDHTQAQTIEALLRAELHWDRVIRRSVASRVAPWVYFSLQSQAGSGRVPADALARVHAVVIRQAIHYVELSRVLEEVLGRFSQTGIPAIVLKGAALATAVYEQPYLRMVGDLDVLVTKTNLAAAAAVLRAMGMRQLRPHRTPPEHHHLPGFSYGTNVRVELHWHIVEPESGYQQVIAPETFWNGARLLRVGAVEAWMFSPEHLLLHAALHILTHRFSRMLYQLCDIREIVSRFAGQIDWDSFLAEVSAYSLQWPVYLSFQLAADLAGAAIPARILEILRASHPQCSLRRAVLGSLLPLTMLGGDPTSLLPEWRVITTLEPLMVEIEEWNSWKKFALIALDQCRSYLGQGARRDSIIGRA